MRLAKKYAAMFLVKQPCFNKFSDVYNFMNNTAFALNSFSPKQKSDTVFCTTNKFVEVLVAFASTLVEAYFSNSCMQKHYHLFRHSGITVIDVSFAKYYLRFLIANCFSKRKSLYDVMSAWWSANLLELSEWGTLIWN